jgi:Uma2 family endonuclease
MVTLARKGRGRFLKCAVPSAHDYRHGCIISDWEPRMAQRASSAHDWTVARLHALPEDGNRYEIIDGVLYVTPAPRYLHQWALGVLHELLIPYVRTIGLEVMHLDADIEYSPNTLVQPDLFVYPRTPGKRITEWADVQPLQLVVEALSPATRRRDRTVKRVLYQRQGVPEYWIIDLDARAIERWRPDSTEAESLVTTLAWQPQPEIAPFTLDIAAYFQRVLDE